MYDCFATYKDNSTEKVQPTWSASDGTIQENGLFVAPWVAETRDVTIHASYEDGNTGEQAEADLTVRIVKE